MIDMGSRCIDRLEKLGHEIETILGCVEKLAVTGNLSYGKYFSIKVLWRGPKQTSSNQDINFSNAITASPVALRALSTSNQARNFSSKKMRRREMTSVKFPLDKVRWLCQDRQAYRNATLIRVSALV